MQIIMRRFRRNSARDRCMPMSVLLGCVAVAILAPSAAAEIIQLTTGGEIRGEIVDLDPPNRDQIVVDTALGRVVLARSQVQEVVHQLPAEKEYEQIAASFPDTVEGQWSAAEWCREKFLTEQRRVHLERIIEFEPDHAAARRILGYRQVGGRWVTQEELMAERGMVRHNGRWMTPQQKRLFEERQKTDVAEKEWMRKLKRWRQQLEGSRASEAAEMIAEIDDPFAIRALDERLPEEPNPRVRQLYMQALSNIDAPRAVSILAERSLEDPEEELREVALEYLAEAPRPDVAARYVEALHSQDNTTVNRAAVGLLNLGWANAVPALVEALVTTHRYILDDGRPAGSTTSTFGSGPGGSGTGFSTGGGGPKVVYRTLRNPAVLDALVGLTGQNFEYEKRQWKQWLATLKRSDPINTRRD